MRFILLEGPNTVSSYITPDIIKTYKTGDPKTKESTVRKIMTRLGNSYTPFYECFTLAASLLGIDPKYNPFWDALPKIIDTVKATDKHVPYLTAMVKLYNSGHVSDKTVRALSRGSVNPKEPTQYLANPSLYYRNLAEFEYTVKAFEIVLDPNKLTKFIKDTSHVKITHLYDGNDIKPAGLNERVTKVTGAHKTDTIKAVIEWWTRVGGDNGGDTSQQEPKKSSEKEEVPILDKTDKEVAKRTPFDTFQELTAEKDLRNGDVAYVKNPGIPGIAPSEIKGAGKPGFYVWAAEDGWRRAA